MDKFVYLKKRKSDNDASECKKCVKLTKREIDWTKLSAENLDCDYTVLFNKGEADELLRKCSELLEYNTGDLAKVKVFGKWHDIPRKQVCSRIYLFHLA